MSTTIEEVIADEAFEAQAWAEAMEDLRGRAIAKFQQGRLRSYYAGHLDVAAGAIESLKEARSLFDAGFIRPSLVFAVSASEQALKNALLRPMLYGLVHSETAATLVASLDVRLERIPKLLFPIIAENAGVDLSTYCRAGQSITWWDEFRRLQRTRHGILHRGQGAEPHDAETALAVASAVLDDVVRMVIAVAIAGKTETD